MNDNPHISQYAQPVVGPQLQAPRVLLLGDPGSGKTDSLTTFIQGGLELFVLVTEPSGVESLIDSCRRRNLDITKLHWHVVTPGTADIAALRDMAMTVKAMSYKDISEIKQGVGKPRMQALEEILSTIADFRDDRTGQSFGDVTDWPDTRAFALDSLSGLNMIAMAHTVGFKPSAHQGEWGVAMNLEEQILLKLTADCGCFFALIAHVDAEFDTVRGTKVLAPAALGSKLGPRIPRFFSEVVLAKRDGTNFAWSTAESNIALKNRALSVGVKLTPSFVPIIDAYKHRKALAGTGATPIAP